MDSKVARVQIKQLQLPPFRRHFTGDELRLLVLDGDSISGDVIFRQIRTLPHLAQARTNAHLRSTICRLWHE